MTHLIEFFIKQILCAFWESLALVWGLHLWDKMRFPFSIRKWFAVFLIFTAVVNMIGVQIGVVKGIVHYIDDPNGIIPPGDQSK